MYIRRLSVVASAIACEDPDAQLVLDSGEDPCVDLRLVSLRGQVDDPPLVRGPSKVLAHASESWPTRIRGRGYKCDYPGWLAGMGVKYLPSCPAPEVDRKVGQHVLIPAVTLCPERIHWTSRSRVGVPLLNPAAKTPCAISVRRVADDHEDRRVTLDLVRLTPGPRDRLVRQPQVRLFDIGVVEGVGDEEL